MAIDISIAGFLIASLGAFRAGDHGAGLLWLGMLICACLFKFR